MDRFILTDAQWAQFEPRCLGKPTDHGRSGRNNRMFMEAVLWIARTGSPWRDPPALFGNRSTAFRRFSDWRKVDVFKRIFDALSDDLSDDPDMAYAMVDATIVKVHRHGQGAKGGLESQAIGRSKGGMTTKILALTDALGNLVRFVLMPGNRYNTIGIAPMIDGIDFDALLGDKAFDANWIVEEFDQRGAKVVGSQWPKRLSPLPIDEEMYKWRT